ncbi:50S ribosomal protein L24 [Patescibacteria group bacterium]|nr:50S ribosomal protein L24 [Patescibacteria group bacterium]
MRIKKGDNVKILTGKDSGKSGKVVKVYNSTGKLVVEGLNLYKKHVRAKTQNEKGEIVDVPRPINASNVLIICPSCHKAARIGMKTSGEKKERFCRKCQAVL